MTKSPMTEALDRLTVQQVDRMYTDGKLTAKERMTLIREKARHTLDGKLAEEGFARAILTQTIQRANEGWEAYKQAIAHELGVVTGKEPLQSPTEELKNAGKGALGAIGMVFSAINAIGEVSGQQIENTARNLGASPGVARVLNHFVNYVAVPFFPVGKAVQVGAKGVQAASRLTKGAQKASKAASVTKEADAAAGQLLSEGLKAEGSDDAVQATRRLFDIVDQPAASGVTAATKIPLSIREQFLADAATFKDEMAGLSATQSHEATAKMAERLGLTLDDLKELLPHTAVNEAEMYGYLKALEPVVQRTREAAVAVVRGGDEAAVNTFAQQMSEFYSVLPKFRGAEITGGRSVEILKERPPAKALSNLLLDMEPEAMAAGDFTGAMKTLAEDFLALPAEKAQVLAVQAHSGLWPKLREAYINLLLPFAFIPSFVGNSIAAGQSILERAGAGAFSIDPQKGVAMKEAYYLSKGMTLAVGDAIKAFGKEFKQMTTEQIGRLDYQPGAIPGALGRFIRIPTHAVAGMDSAFKTLNMRGSYYAEALRDAEHAGLTGKALGEFIQRRVTYPTQTMRRNAEELATTNTFQNELGGAAKAFKNVLQYGPGILYFTFMKSPINLIKYGWERTPGLNLLSKELYKDIAGGGVKADEAIGRLTISSLQAMFIWNLAKEGYLTGSGPVDPNMRAAWLATHEPYSIYTKEGWKPYSNQDPATTLFGVVSDMSQIWDQLDEGTAEQLGMAASFAIMRNMADKTWWPNLSTLIDATQNIAHGQSPGQQLKKVALSPLVTVATGGPIGGRIKNIIDPVRRDARSFTDMVMARTPYFSKDMPALRDRFGDVQEVPQPVLGSWFGLLSPLWPKKKALTDDRVKLEADRLKVRMPSFGWSLGGSVRDATDIREMQPGDKVGVGLTIHERDAGLELYRRHLRHKEFGIEAGLLDTPEYQEAPVALKTELFEEFVNDAMRSAREELLSVKPDIGKRLLRSEASSLLPQLQPEDRGEAASAYQESIDLFDGMAQETRDAMMKYGILTEEEAQ